MPPVQFSGLASGLDTRALIDAILDFERRPIERLSVRRDVFDRRRAALAELGSRLSDFESSLRDLSSSTEFRGRTSSVDDETVLRATAGSGAETGLFQVEVGELATASKVKSDGFTASDQLLVGDGTITLQAGDAESIVIDVSAAAGNNSLEQVRNAINAADAGIEASVLYDGTSYRLIVRSAETGIDNALQITDTTDLGLGAVGNQVTAAADAEVSVDGIDVTSPTNKITGVIPGVTLDLLSVSDGSISVEVAQDDDRVVENVQSLVDSYNKLVDFFGATLDVEGGGVLTDDSIARSIQREIQSLFTGGVDGIAFGGIRSLSAIGVSFDGSTGKASVDATELRELLDTDFEGVGNLFLTSGTTTDSRIEFLIGTNATQPGEYAVEISQAAEQARVDGGTAIIGLAADETLTIGDGTTSIDVTLGAGSGITDIVDQLNQSFADQGVAASAQAVGGRLQIVSQGYGSAATISVTSDRSGGTGFTTTTSTSSGLDVEGTIDGVAATGNGQVLSASGDSDAAGLQIRVLASAAAVTAAGGDFGSIAYSRGLVPTVLARVDALTRLGDGPVQAARDSLASRIEQINDDIERFEDRLLAREARLVSAFSAAERAIQALQAQQGAIGGFF